MIEETGKQRKRICLLGFGFDRTMQEKLSNLCAIKHQDKGVYGYIAVLFESTSLR